MDMIRFATRLLIAFSLIGAGHRGFAATPPRPGTAQPALTFSGDSVDLIVILKEEPIALKMRRQSKQTDPAALRELVRTWTQDQKQMHSLIAESWLREKRIQRVDHRFNYLMNGFSVVANADQLAAIKADPRVKEVHFNHPVKPHFLGESVAIVAADQAWSKTDASGTPLRGGGTVIAIIDTGVDYNHPDLGGGIGPDFKVIGGYDFGEDDADPMDLIGHGTHVAGIAAADGGVTGVAPDARILAYKVFSDNGVSNESYVIAAMEAAADPDGDPLTDDKADVINLSLGGFGGPDSPLALVSNQAVDLGIVVVASAGNSGGGFNSITAPGAAEKVLTVGATTKTDAIANFTSSGPVAPFKIKPELCAPGADIRSTEPGGNYGIRSGTSMAAPHVAAAAAILVQRYPEWTPERIINRLMHTALAVNISPFLQGAGRLDLGLAVDATLDFNKRTLNFGRVALQQPTWIGDQTVSFTNVTDTPQTYVFRQVSNLDSSVNLLFFPAQATVGPGETQELTVRALINNASNIFPNNAGMTYHGLVAAVQGEDAYVIPFAIRKSVILNMALQEPGSFSFTLVTSQQTNQIQAAVAEPQNLELHLRPATYILMGSSFHPGQKDVKIYTNNQLLVFQDTAYTVDGGLNNRRVTQTIKDLQGVVRPVTDIESLTTSVFLTNIATEASHQFTLTGTGNDFLLSDFNDGFQFETVGLANLGQEHAIVEFGYRFRGINGNRAFETDMAASRKIVLDYENVDTPSGVASLTYAIINGRRSIANIDTLPFFNFRLPKPPFELTVYALRNPEFNALKPLDFSLRRFSLVSFSGGILSALTQTFRVDQATGDLVMTELNGLGTNREVIMRYPGERISFSSNLIYPIFGFINLSTRIGLNFESLFIGAFSDPWRNGILSQELSFTLDPADDDPVFGDSYLDLFLFLQTGLNLAPGPATLTLDYTNRLNGQATQSRYTAVMDTSKSEKNPPTLQLLQVQQNGRPVSTLTGAGQLYFEVADERNLSEITAAVNPGDGRGWINLTTSVVTRLENRIIQGLQQRTISAVTANFPALTAGGLPDIRVSAEDNQGNRFELEVENAFRVGHSSIAPWIVNNSQWQSRIALYNGETRNVNAVLEGTSVAGERFSTQVTVPAQGVFAANAGALFGERSGYSLKISSDTPNLKPSFLTFNKEPQSGGNSPSQTTGALITDLTPRLLFPYLPGDQIPAVVICAPDRGLGESDFELETPISLKLFDAEHGLLAQKTMTLAGGSPHAFLARDLFENLTFPEHAALVVEAENGTLLAGTTFTFNQQREPSMAASLTRVHELSSRQTIPWIVNNSQWLSRISVYNAANESVDVRFRAVTVNGENQETTRSIPAETVWASDAEALFPDLSGYRLVIETESGELGQFFSSFLTFNREIQSGGDSPSQTTATHDREMAAGLIFGYTPTDQIPAIVLSAADASGETVVTLTAFGSNQGQVATTQISLQDDRPFAALVTDLFPGVALPIDVGVRAVAAGGVKLVGTTFIFNDQREPSMAKPFPVIQ